MISFKQLLESLVSDRAHQLGLKYMGYGRWGKGTQVLYHTEFNRLVPVKHHFKVNEEQLKHLEHVEDFAVNHGVEGARHALDLLHTVHRHLKGEKTHLGLRVKIDGAPSVIYNADENSVGTKSVFAKDAKVNKTNADVEANHPSPGLQTKLKAALKYFPKLGLKGTHQGDMLFTKEDLKIRTIKGVKMVTFKPNTIMYGVPVDSEMGKKILASKVGIVFHTSYDKNGKMNPDPDTSKIGGHPDIFTFDNSLEQHKYALTSDNAISELGKKFQSTPKSAFDLATHPEIQPLMKQFINKQVREGNDKTPTAKEFASFVDSYLQKAVDGVKTEKAKAAKTEYKNKMLKQITDGSEALDKFFDLHKGIQGFKDKLIGHLDTHQTMHHFIERNGELEATNPEGYVVVGPRGIGKLVRRSEFSKNNFTVDKNWTKEAPKNTTATLLFGRMNPVTTGHVENIKHALSIEHSDPYIVASHTQDKKKNPLTGAEKQDLLKSVFPDLKTHVATTELPTALHWAADLAKKGYKKLVVVGGEDRGGMLEIIRKYNGVYDKNGNGYYFPEGIEASSSGKRIEGISGTDMRNHAINNDEASFKRGIPKELHPKAKELMQKIRERLAK